MRILREILRLRFQSGLSLRQIKGSLGAVQKVTSRADELALNWDQTVLLDETEYAICTKATNQADDHLL